VTLLVTLEQVELVVLTVVMISNTVISDIEQVELVVLTVVMISDIMISDTVICDIRTCGASGSDSRYD